MTDFALPAQVLADAVSWRRHLHRHPELAYEERETGDFVARQLAANGYRVDRGLGGTGVVGTLARGTGSRVVGIRADMDALRIQERTAVPHASCREGVMHACGHDGHTAIALAAAKLVAGLPDLDGTVHFIFQPAEEGFAGARKMIEDGLFRRFPCEAVYGLHNWPALPVGTCAALDGPMMAANAVFEITISGRGCHGAMPHEGADCVIAACHLVTALQSVVSRNVSPAQASVISTTQIEAGHTHNVIPEACRLRGTVRWLEPEVGDLLETRLQALAERISASFECRSEVSYERRYPALVNDPDAAALLRRVAGDAATGLRVMAPAPSMGAEDFAFMLQATRGAYLWLGAGRSGENPGLHSPRYDFNDEILPQGIALWTSIVRESLGRG